MRNARITQKIGLDEKFSRFTERWRPKVIASLNGQEVKIVEVEGEFPWRHHEAEDEPAGVVNTGNVTDEIYTAPNGIPI